MKIVDKKYNIGNEINKKIILISDIHYYSKRDIKNLNKVLDKIKKVNPNYICISGDTLDNYKVYDFELLLEWLTKLSNISKVIMVLGNHEFYVNKKKNLYKLNSNYIDKIKNIKNLYLLDNQNKLLDNINFIGLTLPIEHYFQKKESKEDFLKYINNININDKKYNILLCHSPINIIKDDIIKKLDFDLALCGHMHGGLMPRFLRFIFKRKGLISPHKSIFPSNAYGHILKDNKHIIITSGIKVLSDSHLKWLKNVYSAEVVEINL